jgi:hypothetical protein
MAVKRTKKELKIMAECREILKNHPKLKKRKLNKMKNLEKRLYYLKVWSITEKQPLHKLRYYSKRCFRGKGCYHLDHIVSISYGFLNKISPEKIGSLTNLRFISARANMKKGHKLTEESNKVLRKFKRSK